MDPQNLGYALIQLAHNFGAVAVLGGAVAVRWPVHQPRQSARRIARLVFAGWLVQIASGAGFGAASYLYYGQLPDIHGIAIAALIVKIACAIAGAVLAALYLKGEPDWADRQRDLMWRTLALLAAVALAAAAFLRWFS